ncbi:glycosyltransferase 25 family member [Plodia interpunctella]|uniref:glycosyltransferase 25 family member n=1 Tax=Plodia interpunctella TaxID=58824 RepID=UPI0023686F13|nr:glycosyltransferase 25 family member [Plodia interpunctella]
MFLWTLINLKKMHLKTFIIILGFCSLQCFECFVHNSEYKWPTIGISVLVRNKAHTLPYFLTCLRNMDYPKDRLYLWMYSDYNEDNSVEIIETWAENYASEYNGVYITKNTTSPKLHFEEKSPTHWSIARFRHVIALREKALQFAKNMWADYLFMIDADVFLTDRDTLKSLVRKNLTIVAPMLLSDGLYSNFWCGMTENYYYQRTDDYQPILRRENQTCHEVPMVNTAVLISLRHTATDSLTYDPKKMEGYNGPQDDIIAFAISARNKGIALKICNDHIYGFVLVPLEETDSLEKDNEQLLNIKLEAISRSVPLTVDSALQKYVKYPEKWKFGFDEIYMINLERRPERRQMMELSFKELGMDVKLFKAVDGRILDLNDLREYSVTLMPNYEDPYHKRPMKAGEVGCFLSHYYIWEEIVKNKYAKTLILEDDVYFVPYFRHRLVALLDELKDIKWDLLYLGRKAMHGGDEEYTTKHTTRPLYSYWTLGYALSERGASKLLAARPLANMMPVDEFLPVMFDQHPNDTWKSHFPQRNLVALSAAPLLVYPTHYTGEDGYVSDTENSHIVQQDDFHNEL